MMSPQTKLQMQIYLILKCVFNIIKLCENKYLISLLWFNISQYLKIKSGKISETEILKNPSPKTEYHTIVIRGLPYKIKKCTLKEFFKPLKLDSIRLPPKIKGVAYIGFKNKCDAEKCLIKNKSFLSMFYLFNFT